MSKAGKLILGERSPFLKCGTVGDVAEVIRKKCEQLRGKPYKRFVVTGASIRDTQLFIEISADLTYAEESGKVVKVGRFGTYDLTWYDLLSGDKNWRFARNSRLGRWGGGFFRFKLKRSGFRHDDLTDGVVIPLLWMPIIQERVERNEALRHKSYDASQFPYPYSEEEKSVLNQATVIHLKVGEWVEKERRRFRKDNPQTDPLTGKPVKW